MSNLDQEIPVKTVNDQLDSSLHKKNIPVLGIILILFAIIIGAYFLLVTNKKTSNSEATVLPLISSPPFSENSNTKVLFTIPLSDYLGLAPFIVFSPNHQQFAYRIYNKYGDNKAYLVLNGQRTSKGYTDIYSLSFSPDSKQFAYLAYILSPGDDYVIVNGKEIGPYDRVYNFTFSPDGKHFAFVAQRSALKQFIVLDGKEGPLYDNIVSPVNFSPDSKQYFYESVKYDSATGIGGEFIILNEQQIAQQYDRSGDFAFSNDGKQFAYWAKKGSQLYLIVNDQKYPKNYDLMYDFTFSPDGKRFAYSAAKGDKRFIVLDNQESTPSAGMYGLTFSPDSKQFVYVRQEKENGDGTVVINNNPEPKSYSYINKIVFSKDSKQFAYSGGGFIVINKKELKTHYDMVENLDFSSVGNSIIYDAKLGNSLLFKNESISSVQ